MFLMATRRRRRPSIRCSLGSNGPESAFETNDCALRPPWHQSNMFRRELCIQGRLEFLFRQHLVNLHEQNVRWLLNLLTLYMQVTDPTFYLAGHDC